MLALWFVAFWENLEKPKKIVVVELGPGDGSLCYDLLETFKKFKNFQPDIITLSKSLGGGKSSISALVANEKLYNKVYGSFETAMLHTTTYNGFGEECATAIEAINILEKLLLLNIFFGV